MGILRGLFILFMILAPLRHRRRRSSLYSQQTGGIKTAWVIADTAIALAIFIGFLYFGVSLPSLFLLLVFLIYYIGSTDKTIFKNWIPRSNLDSRTQGISDNNERKNGFLNFFCFDEMTVGQKVQVTAEVCVTETIYEQLFNKSAIEETGLNTEIKLRLTGDGFRINSNSNERQAIFKNRKTTWKWNVTPHKSGPNTIDLHVSLVTTSHGFYDLPSEQQTVYVHSNSAYILGTWLGSKWEWIITMLVGSGIMALIIDYLRGKS